MDATIKQLRKKHPDYEQWSRVWPDYKLAYRGGFEFLWNAGQETNWRYGNGTSDVVESLLARGPSFATPRRRFLRQLEGEPNAVYQSVWDRAEYINYLGGILNYFDSWLFATNPIIQASEGTDKPDWWEKIERDATGGRVGFFDFIKRQFLEAMICRRSGWMLGRQDDVAAKDADDDAVNLTPFNADEIWDWEISECGELVWVVLGKCRDERVFPDERLRVETITYLDAAEWTTWEVTKNASGTDEVIEKIGEGVHGLPKVPFVMLELPRGLWATDQLFAWAVGLFNQWTRLRSAMLLGCIMQPYIAASDDGAQSRIFGEGVLLKLRPANSVGDGAEDFGWKTPDTKPLEFIWSHFKEAVAEGYRIMHQMSMAVDAKSVASIARSGASKVEDRKSTEVILRGLGGIVRDAEMRTLSLLSDVYGDGTTWTVDGYDDFSLAEPLDLLQLLALGETFSIDSTTYKKRVKRKVARIMLDGEDESTMGAIEEEIDEAEDAAEESKDAPPQMDPATGMPIVQGTQPMMPGGKAPPEPFKAKPAMKAVAK